MLSRKSVIACAAAAAFGLGGVDVSQGATLVGAFGQGGWRSDDTRSSTGTDLVGINYTNAGDPGVTPSAADDTAISNAIIFQSASEAPAGSDGAVKLIDSGPSSKVTISTISNSGFASSSTNITGSYRYYSDSAASGPQIKIGIRSTDWAASQTSFTATRSGESSWDLVLVAFLDFPVQNAWTTYTLDANTKYRLFRQSGNAYFATPGGYGEVGTPNQFGLTLSDWNSSAWGSALFDSGATINNIQFGLGSGAPASNGWVDSMSLNVLNGGETVNYVPEPSILGVAGLAAALLMRRRRRA
jgi:hypothetical protein